MTRRNKRSPCSGLPDHTRTSTPLIPNFRYIFVDIFINQRPMLVTVARCAPPYFLYFTPPVTRISSIRVARQCNSNSFARPHYSFRYATMEPKKKKKKNVTLYSPTESRINILYRRSCRGAVTAIRARLSKTPFFI